MNETFSIYMYQEDQR